MKLFERTLGKEKWLYFMMIPGILNYLIFEYGPMFGLVMAFQEYNVALGFWKSPWVGFAHFQRLFSEPTFWMLLSNTLILSVMSIVIGFPAPIILALLLNEIRIQWYKRFTQTLIYVPHFISWVVIYSITYTFFTVDGGVVNGIIEMMGGTPIRFLTSKEFFRPMIVIQGIWKEGGWGTIVYLAALAAIDPELYEAAEADGANRWQKLWHITLPGIRSTIAVLLILRVGDVLSSGFEQVLLMSNALNRSVAQVFDTYVYMTGILGAQFSYTAAVGMWKSVVALILIVGANRVAKWIGEEGIF
jgi:putative aldouronate transport system permease protein